MKILLIWTVIIHSNVFARDMHPLSDEFINSINHKQTLWKAGRNFARNIDLSYFKKLMGVLPDKKDPMTPLIKHNVTGVYIPIEFDARKKWNNCPTINEITDQGSCGSCWAVAAVDAISDRICIHSNGSNTVRISADDLMSCNRLCRGCNGGFLISGWSYWVTNGLVSGGPYGSNEGCKPYEIPPCEHYIKGPRPNCTTDAKTPKCYRHCQRKYNVAYGKDKHYGKTHYRVLNDVQQIQVEIMMNGPVEASFEVFEDFIHYKSGVYRYVEGKALGGHGVRIIGWGVEASEPYWLVANSWNYDWGNHGIFKMIRGIDHLGFESGIVAGSPLIKHAKTSQ